MYMKLQCLIITFSFYHSNISSSTAFPAVFEVLKFTFNVQAKLDQKECRISAAHRNKISRTLYENMAHYKK